MTICSFKGEKYWGDIVDGEFAENEKGKIIIKWIKKLSDRYDLRMEQYQVMPNHVHLIINVGAHHDAPRAIRESPLQDRSVLSKIIGYLKMNVSKEIGVQLWQRNYYEHIIRNERELNAIRQYTIDNPKNWGKDKDNPVNRYQGRR